MWLQALLLRWRRSRRQRDRVTSGDIGHRKPLQVALKDVVPKSEPPFQGLALICPFLSL